VLPLTAVDTMARKSLLYLCGVKILSLGRRKEQKHAPHAATKILIAGSGAIKKLKATRELVYCQYWPIKLIMVPLREEDMSSRDCFFYWLRYQRQPRLFRGQQPRETSFPLLFLRTNLEATRFFSPTRTNLLNKRHWRNSLRRSLCESN
jgi:hypothetical protein